MKSLSKNWITEGLLDFEYKKYVLLAYLQEVSKNFSQNKLYPFLSDLVFHYQNLITVKEKKQLIYERFPKEISRADFETMSFVYKQLADDDRLMNEIEEILNFSIPELQKHLDEGKDIYQYVEENLHISPVGIMPLYPNEGYVFLTQGHKPDTQVFEYQISIFENTAEKYRGIRINFLESYRRNLGQSYEMLKIDLVRRYKKLPNPATYLVESRVNCPFEETLLPVAKRSLIKYIVQQKASA